MLNKHILLGCRSRPLSVYLKSLAVLRLLSEQKDREAKGWWEEDFFVISTHLSAEQLEHFFCHEYSPTPIVAPWNGGSGFFPGDATDGMNDILASNSSRFLPYVQVINEIKSWPEMPVVLERVKDVTNVLSAAVKNMQAGKKHDEMFRLIENVNSSAPESIPGGDVLNSRLDDLESLAKKKTKDREVIKNWWASIKKARTECSRLQRGSSKEVIISLCRSRLPEVCLNWLDSVCAVHENGNISFHPVLGTGGNEGRLDLSNNFMQRVAQLLLNTGAAFCRDLLGAALYGKIIPGLVPGKIGQYDPGRAGGFNQGMEIETKNFKINPWDFILTLEGAVALSGAVVRRNQTGDSSQLASPFTVSFSPVGFSSSEYEEKGRSETWLPLWSKPASYSEVRYLFSEGRSTVGRRQARTGLDFSLAVGTLGVDRGIDAFERYAFLERRGKSYVALPAGRFTVKYDASLELLNEMDLLIDPLNRFLRGFKNIPATFESARRQIDEALFVCCKKPDSHHFSDLIRSMGRMEQLLAARDRSKKPALFRPLSGLSPRWIALCDDSNPEVRIAASLASIQSTGKVGPLRSYLTGVDASAPWRWSKQQSKRQWLGSNFSERLGNLLFRRMMDAERFSAATSPVEARVRISPSDVMPFVWGETDDRKIEELLWGFSVIDWNKPGLKDVLSQWQKPLQDQHISRTWSLLKLLYVPHKIRGAALRRESRIVHLLMARRVDEACALAIRRLRISELKPFDVSFEEELNPDRLLASLLIPIKEHWQLESLVLKKETATA